MRPHQLLDGPGLLPGHAVQEVLVVLQADLLRGAEDGLGADVLQRPEALEGEES